MYIDMLIDEKKMIVKRNQVYCQDRGIYVDKDEMKLVPKELEDKLNEKDKKAYQDLVKAMIFLKRVDENKDLPEETLAAVPDTFLAEILKFEELPLKVINDLIELANSQYNTDQFYC